jgi:hypothetical protein
LAGGVGSHREDRAGGDGGPGCVGLAAGSGALSISARCTTSRELESLKAAARQRVAAGHVFTPALALARKPLLEAAGLTFSVAVSSYG